MTNAILKAETPHMEMTEKYSRDIPPSLNDDSFITQQLLSRAVLRRIITEVNAALIPADKNAVVKWARTLIGGYPAREMFDEKIFTASMVFDLKEFPKDIIAASVHKIRRENKFLPTCSEVHQACLAMMNERRKTLRYAELQLKEHDRREEDAKSTIAFERTPEQKARIAKLVAETTAKIAAPDLYSKQTKRQTGPSGHD